MMMSRWDRQQRQLRLQRHGLTARNLGLKGGLRSFISRRKVFRFLLISLAIITILPPLYFYFKLRRFYQIQSWKCSWIRNPPLVCAHGGDSSKAFPNTMDAYHIALGAQVDCIEIDVSRSSYGVLIALHDRQGFAAIIWEKYFQGRALEQERDYKTGFQSSAPIAVS